jgi:subtilisin family serine protease
LGLRVADARDFSNQSVGLEQTGDAEVLLLPEIGVAILGSDIPIELANRIGPAGDGPIESIDRECFVFTADNGGGYLGSGEQISKNPESHAWRSGAEILQTIAGEEYSDRSSHRETHGNVLAMLEAEEVVAVFGATWGLTACNVPSSIRSAAGIKVAVLGTGMDLGHPDFSGRAIVSKSFTGQPVQDLNGHGTHMTGTSCGPKLPPGSTPRYGIGYRSTIFVGKILTNSGIGTQAGILTGMNWAIANGCAVIFTPIAGPGGPFPAYTAAGQAALNKGCLMIAASSSAGATVGAPANSPTIMSVAAVDQTLKPSSFSPSGKIEIAAPGENVFSSWARPTLYNTISGLATAGAHVAGCAALWAETSHSMRGMSLWRKLIATARHLPFPSSRVGAGLVQAP